MNIRIEGGGRREENIRMGEERRILGWEEKTGEY